MGQSAIMSGVELVFRFLTNSGIATPDYNDYRDCYDDYNREVITLPQGSSHSEK